MRLVAGLLAALGILLAVVGAQNTTFTSSVARTTTITSRGATLVSTIVSPTTITSSLSSPSASSTSSSATPSPSAPPQVRLDTVLDPGFGVLGALLILTGLPCAFLGHKNRWSSYFLTGFYSLSLVCLSLILKFGILPAVNPPSRALRGLFVLACAIAGIGGGAISILFWGQAKYFVGGLGGFALALWIQCFHNGGLIRAIGYRWIFYIGCAALGFVLCTIPKIHYHVLLASTAIVGATAFMLGVDCFTLVGLKEFYVYNLGFVSLFPKFSDTHFPVTQTMQIEIGLIAAAAVAGTAIQLRILAVLQIKLQQIRLEQKRRNEEVEARAAERFAEVGKDLARWEREHGRDASRQALLKDLNDDDPTSPDALSNGSTIGKQRHYSGMSELLTPTDDKAVDDRQGAGPLPLLNLGEDLVEGIAGRADEPKQEDLNARGVTKSSPKERASWLPDFDDLRRSVDWLKHDTPTPSEGNRSRKVSFLSRDRSASQNMADVPGDSTYSGSVERPRVQSMGVFTESSLVADPNRGRSNSTPLRDEEWDSYVRERKLFTPPSGPTEPIPASERPRSALGLVPIPESVRRAVNKRQRRESAFELGVNPGSHSSSEAGLLGTYPQHDSAKLLPTQPPPAHQRSQSVGHMPVQILPPQRPSRVEEKPATARTRTFEELAERHKRKMSDLQRPLAQAEREQADLDAAKARWEHSQRTEKRDVEKRQAESQKRLSQAFRIGGKSDNRQSRRLDGQPTERRSQGLTSDHLAIIPGSGGRRNSTAKVLDWQLQQQVETAADTSRTVSPPGGSGVRHNVDRSVPFPAGASQQRRDEPSRQRK